MPIEVSTNNPLGLTVAGPGYESNQGQILYPGQTGDELSGYGYDFASFPDPQTGINAGVDYIERKITSGKATTVTDLVNMFSPNDLPAFLQTTGLSANSTLDPSQAGLYAAGIAAGEGTLNQFGGIGAFTNAGAAGSSAIGGSGGLSVPGTGATSAQESANPSSSPEGGTSGTILTDIEDFFVRFGLIIIGGLVILVALWQLLSDHTPLPSPGETVKAAGSATTTALATA